MQLNDAIACASLLASSYPCTGSVGGMSRETELVVIGGRSGVGKSTVGYELSTLLEEQHVGHCFIDGDNLDHLVPKPVGDPLGTALTERNLRALWMNYFELGCDRLIYVNTLSLLEIPMLVRAMGTDPRVTAVLLRSSDATAGERLSRRELATRMEAAVLRSTVKAARLDEQAPDWVHRVDTDALSASEVARCVLRLTAWAEAD